MGAPTRHVSKHVFNSKCKPTNEQRQANERHAREQPTATDARPNGDPSWVAAYIRIMQRCWQSSSYDESSIIRSTEDRSRPRIFSRESASIITAIITGDERCDGCEHRLTNDSRVYVGAGPGVRRTPGVNPAYHIIPSLGVEAPPWGLPNFIGVSRTACQQRRGTNR